MVIIILEPVKSGAPVRRIRSVLLPPGGVLGDRGAGILKNMGK
jgi:hypothetical protein